MKKNYIQPMTNVVSVHSEMPLAGSGTMEVNGTDKVSDRSSIGFVKGESSSNHSVWDDDWSAE